MSPIERHEHRRSWTARIRWFLAEFVVVVCGILAALAVNAWWGRHQDRQQEVSFLRQLDADLAASDSVLVAASEFFYVRAVDAAAVSRAFWRIEPPPADSLTDWMLGPLSSGRFRPVTGTAGALVTSGSGRCNETWRLPTPVDAGDELCSRVSEPEPDGHVGGRSAGGEHPELGDVPTVNSAGA